MPQPPGYRERRYAGTLALDAFPSFIHFDGRPEITYTEAQWQRVALVSTSFSGQVQWNGKGVPTLPAREKIASLLQAAHGRGKKLRFWGTPDFENAWLVMMDLKIDILNTDRVMELNTFLKSFPPIPIATLYRIQFTKLPHPPRQAPANPRTLYC